MFEWKDPNDGTTYQLNYIVTHTEDEGPEYCVYRIHPDDATSADDIEWKRLPPFALDPHVAKEFSDQTFGEVKSSIDPRAFDRNDERVRVGDYVTVVQGELGYDADMAAVAKVERICSNDEVKIVWKDGIYMYVHPYDLILSKEENLPTIWEVFHQIRAVRDDLKMIRVEDGPLAGSLVNAVEVLTKYGDYDEPLILNIRAARDGDIDANAIIEQLIKED